MMEEFLYLKFPSKNRLFVMSIVWTQKLCIIGPKNGEKTVNQEQLAYVFKNKVDDI